MQFSIDPKGGLSLGRKLFAEEIDYLIRWNFGADLIGALKKNFLSDFVGKSKMNNKQYINFILAW